MPREFTWGEYIDDEGITWAARVDGDYATDPNRNWTSAEGLHLPPIPREWQPRKVIGLDASGRRQFAVVPSWDSPLWTGASSTFVFRSRQGLYEEATVIGRLGESSIHS